MATSNNFVIVVADPTDAVCAAPEKYLNESSTTTAPLGNDVNGVALKNAYCVADDG